MALTAITKVITDRQDNYRSGTHAFTIEEGQASGNLRRIVVLVVGVS